VRWHHVAVRPFDDLVRDHGAVVMRVCRALLGPADAEDAWSETFLSALQAYPRLRPDSNVRGWLVTIAHRKSIDQLRATSRRARPVGDPPAVTTTDPESAESGGALRAALDALPPKQRQAVVLHYLADLPYAEVATMIDSSEAAARRSAADGIATLRRGTGRSAR
jgi:RNA polymerase sigma factor (sigma-70 family)